MKAEFQYKCRLCGETYSDTDCSEELAQMVLVCTVYGFEIPSDLIGTPPKMVACHAGCKAGYGVSDLIGYTIVASE